MDIQEVMRRLPHRYPFLLVDRVLECVSGQSIRALKNVTVNEPFFPGHFPHRPVLPGVIILEALAQTAGILAFVTAGVYPDESRPAVLRRHRQGALSPSGRARRPADPESDAGTLDARHLEVLDSRRSGRRGGDQRRDDGGARNEVNGPEHGHPLHRTHCRRCVAGAGRRGRRLQRDRRGRHDRRRHLGRAARRDRGADRRSAARTASFSSPRSAPRRRT